MPKFLIERNLAGAGKFTTEQLVGIAQKSRGVLRELGPEIQWVQSYVTADKITCVYIAPNEELIREHAKRGGFPCDNVQMILAVIDPTTEDGALYTTVAAPVAAGV